MFVGEMAMLVETSFEVLSPAVETVGAVVSVLLPGTGTLSSTGGGGGTAFTFRYMALGSDLSCIRSIACTVSISSIVGGTGKLRISLAFCVGSPNSSCTGLSEGVVLLSPSSTSVKGGFAPVSQSQA